jgi:hypothetical protein
MSNSPQNSRSLNKILAVIGLGGVLITLLAIAVHNYLNASNKHAEPGSLEAKNYVGAIARSEQAYFLENSKLTDSFENLGGVMSSSIANDYSIKIIDGNPYAFAIVHSSPRGKFIGKLKPYVAIVRTNAKTSASEAIMCEAEKVSTVMIVIVPSTTAKLECPTSTIERSIK